MKAVTTEPNQSARTTLTQRFTLRLIFSGTRREVADRVWELASDELPIGRELPTKHGILLEDDVRASRVHACLELAAAEPSGRRAVMLRDEQSTNGTFVNGQRISKVLLQDGDLLRVGNSFLIFRIEKSMPTDGVSRLLLGRAPAMRALRHELACVAASVGPVLLLGETGSGKELAAKTLHEHWLVARPSGAFIAVNCAAIPESLAESELFGHVPGAFTNAARSGKDGYFRAAHGGTLFLDEVGELPLTLQAKLLRAIEEKAVNPVGTTNTVPCDVRLVAATHKDLIRGVHRREFRADLYARLAAFLIPLPPLRERREDIIELLERYWAAPLPPCSADVVEKLLLHSWPLNVRELVQLVKNLSVRAPNEPFRDVSLIEGRLKIGTLNAVELLEDPPSLPPWRDTAAVGADAHALPDPPSGPPLDQQTLLDLLKKHGWVIERVASEVNRSAKTVRRWMAHYRIQRTK